MLKLRKSLILLFLLTIGTTASLFAQVSIETAVSRARLAVGEELKLDIIVSDSNAAVSPPTLGSVEGFNSYSQGHSQEMSIINGKMSSRSIFSYVLIANSEGRKKIGPFQIEIGGRNFTIAAVEVEVLPASQRTVSQRAPSYAGTPVSAPPRRALPTDGVNNRDIFVKAWLDKDEVYVNEPAVLTYTVYTRLPATYKGFEEEPVMVGFWIEEFPPEKVIQKKEKRLNGSRYVVADVRRLALFPTEAGVFTINPGVLASTVEVPQQNTAFGGFFSYNIFGRRSSPFMSQRYSKSLPTDPITLIVKALPEKGRPTDFKGAVGTYRIESLIDQSKVEAGTPLTYKLRITGEGNLNTLQPPSLPNLESFKIYDAASSTNISKERLRVEGEKIVETVLVPKKEGNYTIPPLGFSFFDPRSRTYRQLKTQPHSLVVTPAPEGEQAFNSGIPPVEQKNVDVLGKDIRYIKTSQVAPLLPWRDLYEKPIYWGLNGLLFLLCIALNLFDKIRQTSLKDVRGSRLRRSHRLARRKLKYAAKKLKADDHEGFYEEMYKAFYGYFADKLDIPAHSVSFEEIEVKLSKIEIELELLNQIRALFSELSLRRFAHVKATKKQIQEDYDAADKIIIGFERIKLK